MKAVPIIAEFLSYETHQFLPSIPTVRTQAGDLGPTKQTLTWKLVKPRVVGGPFWPVSW